MHGRIGHWNLAKSKGIPIALLRNGIPNAREAATTENMVELCETIW